MLLQTADRCRIVGHVKSNLVVAHTAPDRFGGVVEIGVLGGGEVIIERCLLEHPPYVPAHLRLPLNHISARHERPRRWGGRSGATWR